LLTGNSLILQNKSLHLGAEATPQHFRDTSNKIQSYMRVTILAKQIFFQSLSKK